MNKTTIFLIVAVSITSGILSGQIFAQRAVKNIDFPIAVVDWKSFIDAAITDEDGMLQPDNVEVGMKKAQAVAQNLADQGFVVIESQAVMAAPDYFYVRAEQGDE